MNHHRLLKETEAAEYIGLAKKTLQKRRWAGLPPTFLKVGSSVRYTVSDLDEFLAKGRVER
jgi:predicted DNA-binding transcriptional regulator AlpA